MARHETRHMGDGGEIVIPKDMRERLGIGPGDEVTFEERDGEVVILGRDAAGRSTGGQSSSTSKRSSASRKDCF